MGTAVREQIATVASGMAAGDVEFLEGCRRIALLRGSLSEPDISDPDLLVLVAVESELDDVPLGPAREYWSPDALAAKDKEKADYLETAKQELIRACRALNAKWGCPSPPQIPRQE
jgi:hypothetical protein